MHMFKQITSTCRGKVLIAIWVLTIATLVGFAIAGAYTTELLGYIATSIFPAGILLIISILISYKEVNNSLKIAKIGWVFLSIAVIIFALLVGNPRNPKAHEEVGMIIGYSMCILSFPTCFLLAYIYSGVLYVIEYLGLLSLFSSGTLSFYLTNIVFWLGFFTVGYLQWFKLIPFLIEKWQNKKS